MIENNRFSINVRRGWPVECRIVAGPESPLAEMLHALDPSDASNERILDAALACFTDAREIKGVTMNAIADRAGLGVATVYRRFARKELLVQAVLLREARRMIDNVDAAVAPAQTLEDEVTEGFVAFVGELGRRPVLAAVFRNDSDALPMLTSGGAPLLLLGRTFLAGLIRRRQEIDGDRSLDAEIVADIYARLAHSLALTPEGAIPTTDDAAVRAFARTYLTRLTAR